MVAFSLDWGSMIDLPFPANLWAALCSLNPTPFLLAIGMILLDLFSGFFLKGVLAHNVQSSIMREGLRHKAWEVALIMATALVDIALCVGMDVGIPQPASTVTCTFIFIMELSSICENALENNPGLANAPIIKYVSKAVLAGEDDEVLEGKHARHNERSQDGKH